MQGAYFHSQIQDIKRDDILETIDFRAWRIEEKNIIFDYVIDIRDEPARPSRSLNRIWNME